MPGPPRGTASGGDVGVCCTRSCIRPDRGARLRPRTPAPRPRRHAARAALRSPGGRAGSRRDDVRCRRGPGDGSEPLGEMRHQVHLPRLSPSIARPGPGRGCGGRWWAGSCPAAPPGCSCIPRPARRPGRSTAAAPGRRARPAPQPTRPRRPPQRHVGDRRAAQVVVGESADGPDLRVAAITPPIDSGRSGPRYWSHRLQSIYRMGLNAAPVRFPRRRRAGRAVNEVALWRRLLAELLGSGFLAAVVVGSGIAAQRLSPGATGLELLEAAATAAGLFAIILMSAWCPAAISTRWCPSLMPRSAGWAGATRRPTCPRRWPAASAAPCWRI